MVSETTMMMASLKLTSNDDVDADQRQQQIAIMMKDSVDAADDDDGDLAVICHVYGVITVRGSPIV